MMLKSLDDSTFYSASIPAHVLRYLKNRLSDEVDMSAYDRFYWALAADQELTPTDKFIGTFIWRHADKLAGNNACPGQELIAWIIGRSVETVRQSVRRLEKRGFIEVIPGRNRKPSQYKILINGKQLRDVPEKTINELMQVFYPQASLGVNIHTQTDQGVKYGHPQTDKGEHPQTNLGVNCGHPQTDHFHPQTGQVSPPNLLGGNSSLELPHEEELLQGTAHTRSVCASVRDNLPPNEGKKPERPIDAATSFSEERLTVSKSEERLTTVESSKNELLDLGPDVNSYNEHMDKRVQDAAFRYLVEQMNKHGLKDAAPKQLTSARRKPFRSCIRDAGGLQGWMETVDRMMRSNFLMGKVPPKPGDTPFQLNFTKHILNRDFLLKILEGNYDNRSKSAGWVVDLDPDPQVEVIIHKRDGTTIKEMRSASWAGVDLWEARNGQFVPKHELKLSDLELFEELVN